MRKKSEILMSLRTKLSEEPTETLLCSFHLNDGNNKKAEFHKDDFITALAVMIKTEQRMERSEA